MKTRSRQADLGTRRRIVRRHWVWAAVLALVLVAGIAILATGGVSLPDTTGFFTAERIRPLVDGAGHWGPFAIVALMVVAVVASPLPSAPIALAAGAAYGHVAGTIYVLIGAELGALLAFLIARRLGRKALQRWLGERLDMDLLGSQNALTYTVFLSRLMPFVSFDLMSYSAGLSCLKFWRFALATFAGILPASFLLAHFGEVAAGQPTVSPAWLAVALGVATGAPLVWWGIRKLRGA